MKKLLTILCTLILGLGLAACSADPDKKVTLKIVDNTGSEEVFEANGQNTTLEDLLDSIAATGIITYEKDIEEEGVYIVSINGLAADGSGNNYWTIYVNGEDTDNTINDQAVNDGDTYEIVYTDENQTQTPAVLGGWKTFETANVELSDDEKAIFEKALDGIVGVGYTPVRVLATQTVSGINYAYLAQGTTVTAQPVVDYYIVTIYADLNGGAEIKAINKLDVTNIESKEETGEPAFGSWLIRSTGRPLMIPDENIQISFDKATEQLVGVRYNPAQLLASQLVSGNNYTALCLGVPATENPATNLYVVTWYADLQGNSTVTDVKMLNLEYYTSGE